MPGILYTGGGPKRQQCFLDWQGVSILFMWFCPSNRTLNTLGVWASPAGRDVVNTALGASLPVAWSNWENLWHWAQNSTTPACCSACEAFAPPLVPHIAASLPLWATLSPSITPAIEPVRLGTWGLVSEKRESDPGEFSLYSCCLCRLNKYYYDVFSLPRETPHLLTWFELVRWNP